MGVGEQLSQELRVAICRNVPRFALPQDEIRDRSDDNLPSVTLRSSAQVVHRARFSSEHRIKAKFNSGDGNQELRSLVKKIRRRMNLLHHPTVDGQNPAPPRHPLSPPYLKLIGASKQAQQT